MEGLHTIRVFRHLGQWWGKLDGLAVFVGPCIADAHAKHAIIAAAQAYGEVEPGFVGRLSLARPPSMTLDNAVAQR